LIAALAANIIANVKFPELLHTVPSRLQSGVILLTAALRAPD